jgi:thioredoxin reductase (NADPH)
MCSLTTLIGVPFHIGLNHNKAFVVVDYFVRTMQREDAKLPFAPLHLCAFALHVSYKRRYMSQKALVGIIGAGPIGLELAIALKQTKIPYIQFEKGQVAQMIVNFPPQTHFFSSSERIGIAGIPIQTVNQQKCSREEYLAYIRSVVLHFQLEVNSYEEVVHIEHMDPEEFRLTTHSAKGERHYHVRFLVLATGGTSFPHLLKVPGEQLPHVSTKMEEPHKYFQKRLVIIGAKNSAVESALRCFNAGAKICLVQRNDHFDTQHVKYWLLPELLGRIERREIRCHYQSEVIEIRSDRILLKNKETQQVIEEPADFIIKAIGFEANMELFYQLGIVLSDEQKAVIHDNNMQVNIPNVFVLGTVVAGTQKRYRIFIENTHEHVDRIMEALLSKLSIQAKWKTTELPSHLPLEE